MSDNPFSEPGDNDRTVIRPTPGGTASFALDTRRICLFDPETERLIA